jgi:monofunctional biosynthetic peptidoglycan transglycosylase
LNRPTTSRRYRQVSRNSNQPLALKIKRGLAYALLVFIGSSLLSVALLRFIPAPTSVFMLNQHFEDLFAGQGYRAINQHWVSYEKISKHASQAVIASEDQLFFQHNGFDINAISKAYQRYENGGSLRGASTISQQVAKNLFLVPAKNLVRKALEIWFTVLLEMLWSKQRILEMYLNIAEFGDHLFGIEAASRHYFGIPAKQLSAEQSALLAATLPNPIRFKANQPSEYVYKRQAWILRQMRNF